MVKRVFFFSVLILIIIFAGCRKNNTPTIPEEEPTAADTGTPTETQTDVFTSTDTPTTTPTETFSIVVIFSKINPSSKFSNN